MGSGFQASVPPRDDFEEMTARLHEVERAPAIIAVDCPCFGTARINPVFDLSFADVGEDFVELGFGDQERFGRG